MIGSAVVSTRNVPADVRSAPFLVTPDPGAVDTAFENAGIVNMRTDRSNERAALVGTPGLLRKLTHFRAPGMGDAMWSGACVYDIAGVSPSFSEYDVHDSVGGEDGQGNNVDEVSVRNGVITRRTPQAAREITTTRDPRVSAHFDSAPAAAFFQGFANTRWSGMFAGYFHPVPRPAMHQNFNPGAMGSKELHKATQYNPVPPMGSLTGYFGTSNDKAL